MGYKSFTITILLLKYSPNWLLGDTLSFEPTFLTTIQNSFSIVIPIFFRKTLCNPVLIGSH